MIFFFLQKVLFSHPDSYNIKKSDIREAPTLSTGAHSSNNTIKYLKTLLGTFTQFVALFWSHVCHVLSVTCSMSGFMRHTSLVTNNNDHIHKPSPPNFPIIHNRLIHRGVAQKKEKKVLKLKINKTEKNK